MTVLRNVGMGLWALALAAAVTLAPARAQTLTKTDPKLTLDVAPTVDPLAPKDSGTPAPLAPGAAQAGPEPIAAAAAVDPVIEAVRARLGSKATRKLGTLAPDDIAGLQAFYANWSAGPLFVTATGFTQRATLALAEFAKADDYGLKARAFTLPTFNASQTTSEDLADLEIKLAATSLTYARFARGGRLDPPQVNEIFDQTPPVYQPRSLLAGLAAAPAADAYLRSLHPKHPQFERLRQALLALRAAKAEAARKSPGVPVEVKIPTDGPRVKPGQNHPDIAQLRQRLSVPATTDEAQGVLDADLVAALKTYQRSHELAATGTLDQGTRWSLNGGRPKSTTEDEMRILVNMERWRWMPETLGDFYVWDSIPEQIARVIDHGKTTLEERIVVGKTDTPTPVFSANMKFVIFNPEWGVPESIKVNELLPRLQRAGYGGGRSPASVLEGQNIRVSIAGRTLNPNDIDWASTDIRRYDLIQGSGPGNVLGMVKFRFPNKHDVYMHDTPEKALFKKETRAYSHGCMRLQNPLHLAEVLLAHDKGWTTAKVAELARAGQLNEVTLSGKLPVHVSYFTTWVGDDGKLEVRPDVYDVDSTMASLLAGGTVQVASREPKPDSQAGRALAEALSRTGRSNLRTSPDNVVRQTPASIAISAPKVSPLRDFSPR